MKKKLLLTLGFASFLALASCGEKIAKVKPNNNNTNTNIDKEPEIEEVPVFVMSGQSNMEGSTNWRLNGKNLLKEYMDEAGEDYEVIENGIDDVLCTNYGFYYPNGWAQAHSSSSDQSSAEGKIKPNYRPTTVGMGVGDGGNDDYFGPELGLAYKLHKEASIDTPIHLIKCAFSGSGFEKTDGPNWKTKPDEELTDEQNASKSLYYLLKRYTDASLKVIEDQGKKPVIKGFLWHQGESDTGNANYYDQMLELIKWFRLDYMEYSADGESKIPFIDCTIYDGSKNRYGTQEQVNSGINAKKNQIADHARNYTPGDGFYEPNFLVDGTFTEHGLSLEIGDADKGGYNLYHYNTKDAFILGEAYADIILNNNLLD